MDVSTGLLGSISYTSLSYRLNGNCFFGQKGTKTDLKLENKRLQSILRVDTSSVLHLPALHGYLVLLSALSRPISMKSRHFGLNGNCFCERKSQKKKKNGSIFETRPLL